VPTRIQVETTSLTRRAQHRRHRTSLAGSVRSRSAPVPAPKRWVWNRPDSTQSSSWTARPTPASRST
jgi:hypothetical protein